MARHKTDLFIWRPIWGYRQKYFNRLNNMNRTLTNAIKYIIHTQTKHRVKRFRPHVDMKHKWVLYELSIIGLLLFETSTQASVNTLIRPSGDLQSLTLINTNSPLLTKIYVTIYLGI